MDEILMCIAASGVFFGAMALRGIFGYLKNKKISLEDVKFDWKTFLTGSIKPVLLTLSIGALAALIIAFLTLKCITNLLELSKSSDSNSVGLG